MTCSAWEQIPQWAWAWESAETLGSLLTDRELAAAYPYSTDLGFFRYGTPLFTLYFQYRDARSHKEYSYRNVQTGHIPAPSETGTDVPAIVMEGGYAVEAGILAQLLQSGETERPPLSPGADLSTARLYYQGEEYRFTGETVYALPGTHPYEQAILLGAVKPSGSREELTGNLDGYVYMQRNLLFPLYFSCREWDEEADGPEPYLEFSIRKGS